MASMQLTFSGPIIQLQARETLNGSNLFETRKIIGLLYSIYLSITTAKPKVKMMKMILIYYFDILGADRREQRLQNSGEFVAAQRSPRRLHEFRYFQL